MLHDWGVIAAAFAYIGLLFFVASYGDRLSPSQRGRAGMLIYPLSLAIYCTSWTFFGSVGFATRTSFDFLAIYVGPILMIGLCTPLLRRVIQLAKSQNITSIADFIAARYGKSQAVAATVAMIAIVGSVPYIALQLKAVASSLETILSEDKLFSSIPLIGDIALVVTLAMAVFAVLFGTRQTDATEHQHGLMLAVATESIVKLVAFLAAGAFVTFWMFTPRRTDRARDEDAGGGARDQLRAVDRQFPHHDAAVVLRDHAAAAAVSRQRGREFQPRGGQPRPLAVSALSGRHQPVRDSDRARRPRHLPVRRRRQRHVRAGAADRGEFAAAQHRRLRRRPVGGDRDGDRGMRRALDHGLQRHRPAAGAAAQPRDARRPEGFRRLPAQDPALCDLRASW